MHRIPHAALILLGATSAHAALIGEYRFDEAANTATVTDAAGLIGNATQTTLSPLTLGAPSVSAGTYGALTLDAATAASFGTAADFSAVAGGGDRFDVNSAGGTTLAGLLTQNGTLAPLGTFTLMAWVNTTGAGDTFLLGTGDGSGNGWKFGLNGGSINFVTAGVQLGASSGGVSANAWHHIAISYNNGAAAFFIDGNAAGTTSFTNYNEEVGTLAAIGSRPSGAEPFAGKVDNLKIYDTALTLPEIQAAAVTAIPEPATYGLLGAGALAIAALRRRRLAR